jgi:hypothetical protein
LHSESTKLREARNIKKQQRDNKPKNEEIHTTSTEILEDKKRYILSNVFEVLDDNEDGVISGEECNFNALNSDLKDFFKPLINEIKDKNVPLSKEKFVKASLDLYKYLTPTQRNALLEAGRVHDRTPKEEEFPFSPSISLKSQELARAVRPKVYSVHDLLNSPDYSKDDKRGGYTFESFEDA